MVEAFKHGIQTSIHTLGSIKDGVRGLIHYEDSFVHHHFWIFFFDVIT